MLMTDLIRLCIACRRHSTAGVFDATIRFGSLTLPAPVLREKGGGVAEVDAL